MAHSNSIRKMLFVAVLLGLLSAALAACGTSAAAAEEPAEQAPAEPALSGDVIVDGSSTVYPITTAVAEEFAKQAPEVRVSVGLSGTGGGFILQTFDQHLLLNRLPSPSVANPTAP